VEEFARRIHKVDGLKTVLLFPFAYFYTTRLSKSTFAFHALFEWLAAALLVIVVGTGSAAQDLFTVVATYLAFISLYELGYMANDLIVARQESDGRQRGPQGASFGWVTLWVLTRIAVFLEITALLNQWQQLDWWLFFLALAAVFTLHNWLDDREMKTSTFAWLAWFRFMAPVIFVLQDSQRMGVGLAAAMGYVAFRKLGYLDGKGLLKMPGRQRQKFRWFFFVMPVLGAVALWPYPEARSYTFLTAYWAGLAVLGTLLGSQAKLQRGDRR
jgi:hypothetical protein